MAQQNRFMVLGIVWFIIIFEFCVFSLVFLWQMKTNSSSLFWVVTIPFVLFSTMTCVCYYKAITTQPGSPNHIVNLTYENLDQIKQKSNQQAELKKEIRRLRFQKQPHPQFDQIEALTRVGYCNACQVVKDLRVHHCKLCNKCIIRMDHHCPWIGNCVGKNNHKFFLQFLFYATTGLFIIWFSILSDWIFGTTLSSIESLYIYPIYVCGVSSGILDLAIGFLFFAQLSLLSHNLTTLQSFIPGIIWRNPWRKQSFKQCLQQIFGRSSVLIPTKPFNQQSYIQIQL